MKKVLRFKGIILTILFVILVVGSCNKKAPNLVPTGIYCEIYDLEGSSYTRSQDVYFKLQPVIFDNEPIDVGKLQNTVNRRYSQGGYFYEVQSPIYVNDNSESISYLRYLYDYYKPGEIRMLVFSNNIEIYEERTNRKYGAADGVPTLENPSKAKPTFFVRREVLYTDVVNHELGHVNGLFHTYEGNDQNDRGATCDTGDKVPTTLTPPQEAKIDMETCKLYLPKYLDEKYTEEEKSDMVKNVESNFPWECMTEFNDAQFQRMRSILNVNSRLQDCILKVRTTIQTE